MSPRFVPVKLDNYQPLREIVFENLREAIISGLLKPGERLMEIQLAEEMGVSRTPVREALRKLELEGFIVMIPRKGAYVAGVSVKDVTDVFEIRAALEGLAAGLAAERITHDELEELERLLVKESSSEQVENAVEIDTSFHEAMYRASRNERLAQMINHLREQIHRFRTTTLSYPGRLKHALDEHRAIVEAISARNVRLAQKLAYQHIESAESSMLESMGLGHQSIDEKPRK